MTSNDCPIEISGLTKTYGAFTAVDGLDLSIKKNSFTGLLGPNGAGKSTTLKILTNLIRASSGSAYLNGVDVTKDPKNALIGVGTVVETPEFYLYLTPKESLEYLGKIIGMTSESISAQTEEILEKVKMTEWADKRLGTFSKGMRQRIALGQALLDDPSIIILDEPTSGLDPRGMAETREILKNLKTGNLTVLMSSHMLYEVSDLCDRVAMINHGKLLVHDDMSKILDMNGARSIKIKLIRNITDDAFDAIGKLKNVIEASHVGMDLEVSIEGGNENQAVFLNEISQMNIGAYSLAENENSLEATYLSLIKESR
jgi:ABC-type multidrug transport system, ATPase component